MVDQEKKLLRIELGIDEAKLPEIAALPWEFLHTPENPITGRPWLATAPYLIFSRRRARCNPPQPIQLATSERLRIAVVVSQPIDDELGELDYPGLWQKLEELKDA